MIMRVELEGDQRIVEELTREAFWNLYVPGADEHFLIHNLRQQPEFVPELSLVAEIDGKIVGYIGYSLSTIENANAVFQVLTFGPVSVLPSVQGKGVGSELIKTSISKARSLGYKAIVIQGYPSYYRRFGFQNCSKFGICEEDGAFPKALQVLELEVGALDGIRGKHVVSSVFETDQAALSVFDESFPKKDKFRTPSQKAFEIMSSLRHDDPEPDDIGMMSICRDRLDDGSSGSPQPT